MATDETEVCLCCGVLPCDTCHDCGRPLDEFGRCSLPCWGWLAPDEARP